MTKVTLKTVETPIITAKAPYVHTKIQNEMRFDHSGQAKHSNRSYYANIKLRTIFRHRAKHVHQLFFLSNF